MYHKRKHLVAETAEEYQVVLREAPPPAMSRSLQIKMARWPKTPGELEKCIGAESVRTIRQEQALCLWCVQRVHL